MIIKRKIENDLRCLELLYTHSIVGPDPQIPVYYSKLGVLELSGWIEVSFDTIARRAVKSRIKNAKFLRLVETAIKRNHGLSYDEHFLDMMAKLIGLPECEALERYLDTNGSRAILTSELDSIINQRRVAAHIALAHTTVGFDSPSVSLGRLKRLYPIVKAVYGWFC